MRRSPRKMRRPRATLQAQAQTFAQAAANFQNFQKALQDMNREVAGTGSCETGEDRMEGG